MRMIKTILYLTSILSGALFLSADVDRANAGTLGPGWHTVKTKRVSLKEASEYFKQRKQALAESRVDSAGSGRPGRRALGSLSAASAEIHSPEIQELARGLQNDPVAIYEFLLNHIDYQPYFGFRKGPTLAFLDGAGNDFDQASLMVSLLRASGFEARYAMGFMSMPVGTLANWLGVEENGDIVEDVLINAAIPFTNAIHEFDQSLYNVFRIWVWLTVDGQSYQLDPAFKEYRQFSTADIGQLLNYNRDVFLSAVQQGATVTSDYVQNVNDAVLRAKLTEHAMQLAEGLREQYPNNSLAEITGGREIIRMELSELPVTMRFSASTDELWDEIPIAFVDTFRVQHQGIDHTFKVFEIGGKRLTITYSGNRPRLRLNGELVAEGNVTTPGTAYEAVLTIDHALPAEEGTFSDQTVTASLISNPSHVYVVVNGLSVSARTIENGQARLAAYQNQGLPTDSEQIIGESLNILGLRYERQSQLISDLQVRTRGVMRLRHHSFGWLKQEDSVSVDWGGLVTTIFKRRSDVLDKDVTVSDYIGFAVESGLEHGIIEQMFGFGIPGLSTIKALWIQNQQGGKVYHVKKSDIAGIIGVLNSTYSASDVNDFQKSVDEGAWLFVPEKGDLVLDQWRGSGYIENSPSALGFLIQGGLNGGHSSRPNFTNHDRIHAMRVIDPPGSPKPRPR